MAATPKYIVVLQSTADAQFEERVVAAGATVTAKWRDRRIIVASDETVVRIAADASVRYVQPISQDAPELPSRVERLQPQADAVTPTWYSGEYLYDASGNIRAIGHGALPSTQNADGKTNTYTYDTHGRLVTSTVNHAGTHAQSYGYDPFGNLTSITRDGVTQTLAVDAPTNRMTRGTYDAAGNLLIDAGFEAGPVESGTSRMEDQAYHIGPVRTAYCPGWVGLLGVFPKNEALTQELFYGVRSRGGAGGGALNAR